MTSRFRTTVKYLLSAVLTVVFLVFAFKGTDFDKLALAMKSANYWWMVAMFACLMLSHIFRSLRWRYLLNPIKPDIGLRNLFSGLMIGYLVNNVLPRAGELVRPYTIGKLESIPKSAALGTIVVERLMDTVSFLLLVAIIPLVYSGPLAATFPWLEQAGTILLLATVVFLFVIVTLMIRRDWTDVLLHLLGRVLPASLARRVDAIAHSFLDGFLFLKHPRNFMNILVLSGLIWGLYVAMIYVSFFAFGLQHLGLGAAIVVQAISSIGVAIPTPGATGGYHWFTAQTLTRLFSVSDEVALSFATVTHAVGYFGVTVFGLFFFLKDHINVREAVSETPGEKR
jgi:uncharacterized protein (TIRG00374 family)